MTKNISPAPMKPISGSAMSQASLPSLSVIMGKIKDDERDALRYPECLNTYHEMSKHPDISTAITLVKRIILGVDWAIRAQTGSSEEDKRRAEKLNYNINTMSRPWKEYVGEASTILEYGFSMLENVFEEDYQTPYGSFIGLGNLIPVNQRSVSNFFFDKKSGRLVGFKQDVKSVNDIDRTKPDKNIRIEKVVHFRFNPVNDSPVGISPLQSLYKPWKYLQVVEEYETIGVAKDLGGVPTFYVDASILAEAENNPSSWQANLVNQLRQTGSAVHAGSETCVIVPVAYDETGKKLFDFKLTGIDGGGKQYDTDKIVSRHSTKLFMAFFAEVLKLGTEKHGSFSLANAKESLLAMFCRSVIEDIRSTFQHQLMRRWYEVNGWEYNPESCAVFTHVDIDNKDIAALASALQRVAAVGLLRPTDDVESYIREEWLNLPAFDKTDAQLLDTKNTSRSGDGLESGLPNGTGDSTAFGEDRSVSNMSNK